MNTQEFTESEIKLANSIAREAGHARATEIRRTGKQEVLLSIKFGYRKNSTGEYVSNAYRNHFGWKNTYYQHAVCVVGI